MNRNFSMIIFRMRCNVSIWRMPKFVSIPLPDYLKSIKEMCPKTNEEEDKMFKVPYSSAVGSLMYAMVCIRLEFVHVVGVVSSYESSWD